MEKQDTKISSFHFNIINNWCNAFHILYIIHRFILNQVMNYVYKSPPALNEIVKDNSSANLIRNFASFQQTLTSDALMILVFYIKIYIKFRPQKYKKTKLTIELHISIIKWHQENIYPNVLQCNLSNPTKFSDICVLYSKNLYKTINMLLL